MLAINPNPESKFVIVTFPQPIDAPMSVEEAKDRLGWLGESVDEGTRSLVAFAEGERLSAKGEMEEVMFFLIYDHDNRRYTVFENWSDEFEKVVLIDGGDTNDRRLLPPEQALAQWIAGFMLKNDAVPGSHRLLYRLIDG